MAFPDDEKISGKILAAMNAYCSYFADPSATPTKHHNHRSPEKLPPVSAGLTVRF